MKITKYDQSCVVIEKEGRKMIIDPVEFVTKIPVTSDIDVVLVTHSHADHLTPDVLEEIISKNPEVEILTTEDNMEIGATKSVKKGDEITISKFDMKFFGENHASIIPNNIPCENIGVVINDTIIHPGDSFDTPPISKVKVLLPAISAPWLKTYEIMRYINTIKPKKVVPVHDALLSDVGKTIYSNWLKKSCDEIDAEYRELKPSESMEI